MYKFIHYVFILCINGEQKLYEIIIWIKNINIMFHSAQSKCPTDMHSTILGAYREWDGIGGRGGPEASIVLGS